MLFNVKKVQKRLDVTIQVTGDCNLACTYCYQHSKNHNSVNIEYAKKFIDAIITNDQTFWNNYVDFSDPDVFVCLQFIGGEPFVNYKAIIELCDYYHDRCIELNNNHRWNYTTFGVCTNGTIYNKDIEDLLKRYRGKFSISVSIDGCKELHDSCRRYKFTGEPTYNTVVKNLKKFRKLLCEKFTVQTKLTVSPDNIKYLYKGTINLFKNLCFEKVPANCVFEDVWCLQDAKELYKQLKRIADWFLSQNMEFTALNHETASYSKYQYGFFNQYQFCKETDFDKCYCGGNGCMLFMQYDGKIYNCNRYSEISIGNPDRDLYIGTVDKGIYRLDVVNTLKSVTRETMYNNECKNCPIAKGCADCVAYCYEVLGDFKKLTTLCDMHKARSLANVYFWNKYFIKYNIPQVFLLHLPVQEALKYVSKKELNLLLNLSNNRYFEVLANNGGNL